MINHCNLFKKRSFPLQANILCPFYSADEYNTTAASNKEQYIIYSVTREEFETCSIVTPNPRIVADCRSPHKRLYFTITFRTFTPSPGGLEFRPGQDYFFISTSDPDNLHAKSGGRCLSHNMRVVFKTAEMNKKTELPDESTSRASPHRKIDRPTARPTMHTDGDKTSKPTTSQKSDVVVFVDNDVSKDFEGDNDDRNIFEPERRPSPKLDPLMYFPIRQADNDITNGANGVINDGIILSSDVAVVTSFRRQSRNQEDVKLEASRMADLTNTGAALSADAFQIIVLTAAVSTSLIFRQF